LIAIEPVEKNEPAHDLLLTTLTLVIFEVRDARDGDLLAHERLVLNDHPTGRSCR
jgi:hypothetical protein